MKSWLLNRRVNALSERLKPFSSDVIRIDFDSFCEPEKQHASAGFEKFDKINDIHVFRRPQKFQRL